jgi:hypothetical protein
MAMAAVREKGAYFWSAKGGAWSGAAHAVRSRVADRKMDDGKGRFTRGL